MATRKKALTLNEQAQEIIRIAEANGVQTNFFFVTTFKRYQVQINILNELEKKIKEDGALVTKEYVKGRQNLYTHPAISDYNRTTDSANKTVTTLIKIIKGFKDESGSEDVDPLLSIINGGDDNDADDE
jgi:tRNA(Phe) wybutosine-synthesizing methylase Tyw3